MIDEIIAGVSIPVVAKARRRQQLEAYLGNLLFHVALAERFGNPRMASAVRDVLRDRSGCCGSAL